MASYLLLRNNKESGPYSLEALVQLGLKPYDLVWEEGRSAAWRYPSEIEGLKPYAPAIEEQPYDRFYKKPSEFKKEEEKKEAAKQQATTPQVKLVNIKETATTSTQNENSTEIKTVVEITTPKKQVFVSLPANMVKKPAQVQQPAAKSVAEPVTAYQQDNTQHNDYAGSNNSSHNSPSYDQLVQDYNSYQPQDKKIPVKEQTITHKEAYPLETKYTQSLDDIKDIYAQTLIDRKKKTAQKRMIAKMLKRGLPFAAVLIVGFFLGDWLMNDKSKEGNLAIQQTSSTKTGDASLDKLVLKQEEKTQSPEQQPAQEVANNTVEPSKSEIPAPAEEGKQINNGVVVSKLNSIQKYVDEQKNASEKTAAGKPSKKPGDPVSFLNETNNSTVAEETPHTIDADPKTGERNRIVRTGNEGTNAAPSNSKTASTKSSGGVWKQVSVKGNDYKRGTFGGIHGLQLTVSNTSNYLLDKVVVELQYLKQNEEAVKIENIHFNMVPPNGSLTLGIPPSMRGVKVAYRVVEVESKAAGDTAGL